jgi:hypothetical protein
LGCGTKPTVVFSWWACWKRLAGLYINVNLFDCYTLLFLLFCFLHSSNFNFIWKLFLKKNNKFDNKKLPFSILWSFQFSFSSSHSHLPHFPCETFHAQWWVWSSAARFLVHLLGFLFIPPRLNTISLVISFLHYSFTATRFCGNSCLVLFRAYFPFIYLVFIDARLNLRSVYVKTPSVHFALCERPNLTLNSAQIKSK